MKKTIKFLSLLVTCSLLTVSCITVDETTENTNSGNGNGTGQIDPNNFQGNITNTTTLQANVTYKLNGPLIIVDGATLNIPAGTRIEASGGTSAYIVVSQGAKLNVSGTATEPVVMTSASATPAPGNWGGLVICGKAPINSGSIASAEVSGLPYGGSISNDNSGTIRYLRIEYAGALYNANKEFNSMSLFGVGSGTIIEYVQAYKGSDDGFEFFGGTVNTSYLVSTFNEDDLFDWTEGWSGTNNYWYGKQQGTSNRGIEADNLEANFAATPVANPVISNISLVGVGASSGEPDGIKLRRGTHSIFTNVYLDNFTTGINIEHDECLNAIPTKAKGKDSLGANADVTAAYTETTTATGAGAGAATPTWAQGWTVGL